MLPLLIYLFSFTAHAQTTPDLYTQHVQAANTYRSSYSKHIKSKNQYNQYHTAATRLDAIVNTNQVLTDRNLWLMSYLRLLRQSLIDAGATPLTQIDSTLSDLNQIQFASTSFTEINTSSKSWQEQLKNSDALIVSTLSQLTSTRLSSFQDQLAGFIPGSPSAQIQSTVNLVNDKLTKSKNLRQKPDFPGSLRALQEAANLLLEISQSL